MKSFVTAGSALGKPPSDPPVGSRRRRRICADAADVGSARNKPSTSSSPLDPHVEAVGGRRHSWWGRELPPPPILRRATLLLLMEGKGAAPAAATHAKGGRRAIAHGGGVRHRSRWERRGMNLRLGF